MPGTAPSDTASQQPPGSKPTRLRASHNKTRSGCVICKQRRIRCGEEKSICRRCIIARRECRYSLPPPAWIFEPSDEKGTKLSPSTALVSPGAPHEARALQFYHEKTAKTMSVYSEHTSHLWEIIVPSATTESSVRHLVIALACRQEKRQTLDSVFGDTLSRLKNVHYTAALTDLNTQNNSPEVLLLAGALFIALGSFSDVRQQSAEQVSHLNLGNRILLERAESVNPTKSDIIDQILQPIFVRLQFMYSLFHSAKVIDVILDPEEPKMPQKLFDLQQARIIFFSICCYRHHQQSRTVRWSSASNHFWKTRGLLIAWHDLILEYASRLDSEDKIEKTRVAAMLAEFSQLFVAFIYSIRIDLHALGPQLRPERVEMHEPGRVSVVYNLPASYLRVLSGLDWEVSPREFRAGSSSKPSTSRREILVQPNGQRLALTAPLHYVLDKSADSYNSQRTLQIP